MTRRAAIALLLAPLFLTGLGGGVGAAQSPQGPLVAARADHMVLDAALHDGNVLVATQSGRIESVSWSQGGAVSTLLTLEQSKESEFATPVSSLAVSPSGRLLALVSSDGKISVQRFLEAGQLETILETRRESSRIVRFLDEEHLLLGNLRGELSMIEIATQREIFSRQIEYDPVYSIAVGPETKRIAVAFRSSRISIVAAEGGETLQTLEGHRDSVFAVAWVGLQGLVSGSKDKSVLLWNLAEPGQQARVLYSADHYVTAIAFDPVSEHIAFTLEDYGIGVMEIASGRFVQRMDRHTAPVQVLRFFDQGRHLLSAGNDARVLIWNLTRAEASVPPARVVE